LPKIKTLTNSQLSDYLDAYKSMLKTDKDNFDYKKKIKCIEVALQKRDLIDFDLPGSKIKKGLISKLLSIFKRNK